jgi:CRISPR-associated protein Cas2
MYVIIVYDVKKDRTEKARKTCQKFLTHTQDSVFEGDLTVGEYEKLESSLDSFRKQDESIIFYTARREDNIQRNVFGEDPKKDEKFL